MKTRRINRRLAGPNQLIATYQPSPRRWIHRPDAGDVSAASSPEMIFPSLHLLPLPLHPKKKNASTTNSNYFHSVEESSISIPSLQLPHLHTHTHTHTHTQINIIYIIFKYKFQEENPTLFIYSNWCKYGPALFDTHIWNTTCKTNPSTLLPDSFNPPFPSQSHPSRLLCLYETFRAKKMIIKAKQNKTTTTKSRASFTRYFVYIHIFIYVPEVEPGW